MPWDFGIFLGSALSLMYPNIFMLAFMCVAMIATIMVIIRAPASLTIMIAFVTFALIAGGSILSGVAGQFAVISTGFLPILILVVVLIGGAIAYAFWRLLGY